MTAQEIATTAITIAQDYNESASKISKNLKNKLDNNEITFEYFLSIQNHIVRPLIVQATKITFNGSTQITEEIEDAFQSIKDGTDFLKEEIDKISKVEKIITIAANILTSVALVAAFAAAPNPLSGVSAVAAITSLIDSLRTEVNNGSEEDAA